MNQTDEIAERYSSRTTDAKSKWYSPSAQDYDAGRPSYPEAVISEVLSKTNINANSTLIEIGSGPGTATQHFSGIGCSIHCVEPNPDFVRIAKQSFQNSPNVYIHQCTFEDYDHSSEPVDIVFSGTAFHWVKRSIAFEKSSQLLKDSGYLVLLWNHELQPIEYEVKGIYDAYIPELYPSETEEELLSRFQSIEEWICDSRLFNNPITGSCVSFLQYDTKKFLSALKSYSPYLELDSKTREAFFDELGIHINGKHNGTIELKLVTGYHIAKKA